KLGAGGQNRNHTSQQTSFVRRGKIEIFPLLGPVLRSNGVVLCDQVRKGLEVEAFHLAAHGDAAQVCLANPQAFDVIAQDGVQEHFLLSTLERDRNAFQHQRFGNTCVGNEGGDGQAAVDFDGIIRGRSSV